MRTKKRFNIKSEIFILLVFIFIGSLCGSVIANNINKFSLDSISRSIRIFFHDKDFSSTNKTNLLVTEFINNIKIILFLWFMGFIPFGNLFLYFILFIKGLCYGFCSSLLFNIYSLKGFIYILKFILPTCFILLTITIFVSVYSIKFSKSLRHITKKNLKKEMFEYAFVFVISSMCIFACNLINIYITN